MSFDYSHYWVSIGVIISFIVTYFTWVYSRDLVPIFSFITGAFFTMWTQERLENRRQKRNFNIEMTKHIYGPLHQELNSILANLGAFQSDIGASLDNITKDFRFDLVKTKLRNQIKEFRERLRPYNDLWSTAIREADSHIDMVLKKYKIKGNVIFHVLLGNQEIYRIAMRTPIFEDETPLDFLTRRTKPYKNTKIIVYAGSKSEGEFLAKHRMHQISTDILKSVRDDPTVQEQRRERQYLLKECASLIESIEKKIVL